MNPFFNKFKVLFLNLIGLLRIPPPLIFNEVKLFWTLLFRNKLYVFYRDVSALCMQIFFKNNFNAYLVKVKLWIDTCSSGFYTPVTTIYIYDEHLTKEVSHCLIPSTFLFSKARYLTPLLDYWTSNIECLFF